MTSGCEVGNEDRAADQGNNAVVRSDMDHWYFSYGSNLWPEQMRRRLGALFIAEHANTELCPRLVTLPKHRVNFSMLSSDGCYYANIIAADEDVLGVIYRCNSLALEKLDVFEIGYDRIITQVYDAAGQTFDAAVYIARPENFSNLGKPDSEYLNRILRGGMHHGLPADYLRSIEATAGLTPTNQPISSSRH